MKRLLLSLAALLLVVPLTARADDVQFTAGSVVEVTLTSPAVTYTLTSSTGISSFSVSGSTLTLTLDAGDSIVVDQSNGYIISNDLGLTASCTSSGASTLTFSQTAVITSSTTSRNCVVTTGGGSSGGGGGGGGGSPSPSPAPVTPTPTTPQPTPTSTTPLPMTPQTPTVTPPVFLPFLPTAGQISSVDPKTGVAITFSDPSNVAALVANLGQSQNSAVESTYQPLIAADAKQFGVTLGSGKQTEATVFVSYGVTPETKVLGAGERRALLRDYFETTKFGNIHWDDIARIAIGQKPVNRNLTLERLQVSKALAIFKAIFGHSPNFKVPTEDIAWNTLLYRIRFPRDLTKEKQGIAEYRAIFGRIPKTPLEWSTVRVLGYVE